MDSLKHNSTPPRSKRRWLQYSLAVALLAFAVGLTFFWVRSYDLADQLHGRIWGRLSFIVASKQGRLTLVLFRSHGHPNWWRWATIAHPVNDEVSFPGGDVRQYETACGFGVIRQPVYQVMRSTYQEGGVTVFVGGAATAMLRGSGLIVPDWFSVLTSVMLGFLLIKRRPWQFSTRSLLVIMTVVAAVLGLASMLDWR